MYLIGEREGQRDMGEREDLARGQSRPSGVSSAAVALGWHAARHGACPTSASALVTSVTR